MKTIASFLPRLLFFSLPVVWLMPRFDLAWTFLLAGLTNLALPSRDMMRAVPYVSSVKLLPFFVLLLATPGLGWLRKLKGVASAVGLYLLLDLVMICGFGKAPFMKPDPTLFHILATDLWDMAGHWLLPFFLWFIMVRKEGLLFVQGAREERLQGCGDPG